MTLVKICGVRELEHARAVAESGANLIGFVFVSVRREVAPEAASEIIARIRSEFETPPAAIGLFVNESAATINRVVEQAGLDLVQFSGDEPPELAGRIDVPVIKALRFSPDMSRDAARGLIQRHLEYSDAVLIDSHVDGKWGGTGVVGDWESAASLAEEFPIVLAGGLNSENVASAIQQVNPAVVDVSSGVEIDGRKDSSRIQEFISAAQAASREPSGASESLTSLIHATQQRYRRSHV